jgi:hypothetical protein
VINFRYHVVSLTAVFLALAIGLVVGTAALNGPAADALNDQVNALRKQNEQYRDQVNHLISDANRQEDFAKEAGPIMLGDRLVGRRVLILAMSSATKYVQPVMDLLQSAGVKVTGRIEVEDKFTDPANNEQLLDLAHLARPPTVADLPSNSNGVETSTGLLAAVLLDRTPSVAPDATRSVLKAYTSGNFLIQTGDVTGPAESVVVLAGAPYVDREAGKKNAAVVTLIAQLDKVAAVVVGIDGVGGDGNAVSALRGDPALSKTVSTVDNVSTPQGRVVIGLALIEQLDGGGKAGHYGMGAGASSLMPKLATDHAHSGS